jgi:hypothetical protein
VTTFELLEVARERNIEFEVRGDRLFQRGPAGAMTEELRVEIRQQKTTLVALLDPAGRFVALKGGLVVPAAALILALDLEARDIPLANDANGEFIVPASLKLLPADRASIRRWHHHLAEIVSYKVPENELPK